MPSSYEHAFRYETSLCSLTEGTTFNAPRTGGADAGKRRPSLRSRLSLRRGSGGTRRRVAG